MERIGLLLRLAVLVSASWVIGGCTDLEAPRQQQVQEQPAASRVQAITGSCTSTTIGEPCKPGGGVECGGLCLLDYDSGAAVPECFTVPAADTNGKTCEGDLCTTGKTCQNGACGTPVVCTAQNQCHTAGVCDLSTGVCSNPEKIDGTGCDDGNACTLTDLCNAGVCTAGTAVSCVALDQCHVAGICDTTSGICSNPQKLDSEGCSDGNACTLTDLCKAGVCTSGTAVTCVASDQCHVAGICESTTGICSNPAKADYVSCDDNNKCTLGETCQVGVCSGGTAVVCVALNDCHTAGSCDPATGCSNPVKPDGTDCASDNNPCTVDKCASGSCAHPAGNAGTPCRISAGVCDPAESCTGLSTTCPGDAKSPASEICRPVATGALCDVAEHCTGTTDACPGDAYLASTITCRNASCTGGVATLLAKCPGTGPSCPAAVTQNCVPYICGTNACGTTCVTSNDCSAGNYCKAGVCATKIVDGQVCTSPGSCASGQCVDGVCCNQACAGQCQACDVVGWVGTCTPVTGKPHGTRLLCTSDGTACGGSCNGVLVNSCNYPGNTTQCRAAACNNDVAVVGATCASTGNCPALQTQPCAPFKCSGTICGGNCVVDPDCAAGSYCSAGICKPKSDPGATCSATNQCKSGYCVDAVCCNSPCSGQCEACALIGKVGTCSPVSGTPIGGRPACATDGTACGGTCNGVLTATCNYPTVSCRAPDCINEVATLPASCDGMGSCPSTQTQNCAPFKCSGPQCSGNCAVDTDCAGGSYCSGGQCHLKLTAGYSCGGDSQCNSGYCVDGVCCGGACVGQCEACDISGQEGSCLAVTGAPHGPRPQCTNDGTVCAGTCDGLATMNCNYPGSTLQCRAGSCSNNVASLSATCTGIGACPLLQTQTCDPFVCVGDQCAGNCTVDTDCAAGNFCSAGVCKLKLDAAQPCGGNNQCTSGACADGYCCNSACLGQCEACDSPSALGTCSLVIGAPHGGKGACAGAGTCQGQCDGSSPTACVFPGTAVECSAASCANGTQKSSANCDGAGTCGQGTSKACGDYMCSGTTCLTSCSTTSDCTVGHACVAKACVQAEAGPDAPLDAPVEAKADSAEAGDAKKEGAAPDVMGDVIVDQGQPESGGAVTPPRAQDDGGCGCRAAGSDAAGRFGMLAAIAALGLMAARRRGRAHKD